ncbi:MAG: hypothetical protein GX783_13125 [Clostridiales bacterium]|nr:hypothetical protein [Clostridiales bacterium]
MDIHISLASVLNGLLYILGVSIGVFLIIVLNQIRKTVHNVNSIITSNIKTVNNALEEVPSIIENTKNISADVKYTVDKLKISLPGIFEDAHDVTSSVKKGTESVSNAVDSISSTFSETAATAAGSVNGYITIFRVISQIGKIVNQAKSK